MNNKTNNAMCRYFYRGVLEKTAGLVDSLLVGTVGGGLIGNAASKDGRSSESTAVGAISGLSAGLGAELGKNISSMLGLGDGMLPQAIGAIAGLSVMKSLYDKAYTGKETPYVVNSMTEKLDTMLSGASSIADKSFGYVPFNQDIKSFYQKSIEPIALQMMEHAQSMSNKS